MPKIITLKVFWVIFLLISAVNTSINGLYATRTARMLQQKSLLRQLRRVCYTKHLHG